MIILDTLLLGGIKFVLGKIAAAVDAELNDDTALKEELLAAQMRLEMGELSEEEFAADRARAPGRDPGGARAHESAPRTTTGELRITGIEATTWSDESEDDGPTPRASGRDRYALTIQILRRQGGRRQDHLRRRCRGRRGGGRGTRPPGLHGSRAFARACV